MFWSHVKLVLLETSKLLSI